MPDGYRRLVLPPSTADAERAARLADALQDAIHAQNRLAANSPYILRFVGPLEERDGVLSVAHEPATPLDASGLFDPTASLMEPPELVRLLVALVDALAVAHGGAGAKPVIHGGLCPGVLLVGGDGLPRVTDFGFAPAVCKTLGVDPYLNLAVRPHTDGTGAWEVLPVNVVDRDDRLCAFIDPDKYGSEALASFETGSDLVAAGMVAALYAEHVHPYLYFEPEAHRVVDMARMMGFGIPAAPSRAALTQTTDPSVRAWLELVTAMLARLPGDRPTAAAIAQRLLAVAPAVDLNSVKVQRWLAQVEHLLSGGVWGELEAVLDIRPPLEVMSTEQRARAQTLETTARERLAEEGRKAAADAELQAVAKWFGRLQNAVSAGDWEKAQSLLGEKPQVDAWPPDVLAALEPLTAKIAQSQGLRKAQSWLKILQKTAAARNWAGVAKLLGQKPPLPRWPDDLQAAITAIERDYAAYQEQQDKVRRAMAEQHATARAWAARGKELIEQSHWDAALDVLEQPPQLEHWPGGLREEVANLVLACRTRLVDEAATNIDVLTEGMRLAADGLLRPLAEAQLAGLIAPTALESVVEFITWAPPDVDADARARVCIALRTVGAQAQTSPLVGELDFRVREDGAHLCGGQDAFVAQIAAGLIQRLCDLQQSRLRQFEKSLQGSVFSRATCRADISAPVPQLTAEAALLGSDTPEGRSQLELRWRVEPLTWEPVDGRALVTYAIEVARQGTTAALLKDLQARSDSARLYKDVLRIQVTPVRDVTTLPTTLAWQATIVLGAARDEAEVIFATTVTVEDVGQATWGTLVDFETRLRQRVVEMQSQRRETLGEQIKAVAKAAPSPAKVTVPRHSKVPLSELAFEVKPKAGDPFVLKAAWNPGRLAYELPADWEQRFGASPGSSVAAQAAAPSPTRGASRPGPVPDRGRPASEKPAPVRVAPSKVAPTGSKRGLVIGGAVGGLALVAVVLFFALRGGTAPAPLPVAPTNPPAVTASEPAPPQVTPPSPPPEPVVAREPDQPAPPPEPPVAPPEKSADAAQEFATYLGATPDRFGAKADNTRLLREFAPSGDAAAAQATDLVARLMVPGSAMYSEVRADGGERVAFTLRVNLRAGAEPVTQELSMQRSADAWVPAAENAAALAKLAEAARTALKPVLRTLHNNVTTVLGGGTVAGLRPRLAEITPLLASMADDADAAALVQAVALLPPPWEEQQAALTARGYVPESDRDPGSGYPTGLRDAQGHRLLLVSVPPQDALWTTIAGQGQPAGPLAHLAGAAAGGQRAWMLYYVDEKEVAVDGAFAQATTVAAQLGRAVPTVDEWALAVLRWGAAAPADLLGGVREWCTGAAPDTTVACGGMTRKILAQDTILPPPPKKSSNLSEIWKWLSDPLVLQVRDSRFDDELTGVRPVLRLLPK